MGPGDLSRALAPLGAESDPRLLIGRETSDDAGIFVLRDDLALVQTVDFFAPIVDDPYTFGRIAAANALSDIFAMGGEPLTAMNLVGFPVNRLPLEVLTDILRGGHEMVHQAGAALVGGHSIIDEEVKYGLAVTGRAHPARLLTNADAHVGDALVLTKPIGTGLLATAAKQGDLAPEHYQRMIESMTTLNADASRAALALDLRCATDITGFGLLGHASHIARASAVTLRIEAARVPVLAGAAEAWRAGARTGGGTRNEEWLASRVRWSAVTEAQHALLLDPQTSGGLLVAVPEDRLADYLSRVPGATRIGVVVAREDVEIVVS